MPTPDQHALLSASSAERWLNCTPAPRLEATLPESTSSYAEAGRLAHAIAELKARKYFLEPMSSRTYNARLKKLKESPDYAPGMDGATDTYLEFLKSLAMSFGAVQPFVALETRLDFSAYAPEGFGTADCILIGAGRLYVCDYKNGAGVPVAAEGNSQMMLYALGALAVYAPIFGDTIREIHLAIIQPNAGGVKEWSLSRKALETWGETVVRPASALAFAGAGAFAPGEWCRFCRASAQCSARAAKLLELEDTKDAGFLLSDAQVGDVLTRGAGLVNWYNELKDYALSAILAGRDIPGYKAVEGRGTREWKGGTDAAFPALQAAGVDEALLYERRPVTPPALEKALGKQPFAETAGTLVEKLPGKPALAPEHDPRKPYNPASIAFGGGGGG